MKLNRTFLKLSAKQQTESPGRAEDSSPGQASLRAQPRVTGPKNEPLFAKSRDSANLICGVSALSAHGGRGANRRRRAFTLVEVLLAMAIFTMLMAALYATWVLVMRATTVGKRTAAQLQRERIAMQTLENSLTFIQSHQASIDYYLFIVQNGDSPVLSFTAYLPDDFPRSGEFLNAPGGSPMDLHLRRLTYSLQQDEDGEGKDLVLRQNPYLMDLSSTEQNQPLVLAKNVTDFLVECWDTNTAQWATEWDPTNIIPPLVRVTLGFANPNSHDSTHPAQVVTRLISFPSTTMPTAVQTPNGNGNFLGGRGLFNQGNNQDNNNPGNGQGNGQPGMGQLNGRSSGNSPFNR